MNAIFILYAGDISEEAFHPLINGENSVSLAALKTRAFPGVKKTVLLAGGEDFSFLSGVEIERKEKWTKRVLLEEIARLAMDFDLAYFAFADCPFLDLSLAEAMAERHTHYAAEYSYADGWPYGLAAEILSRGTPAILAKIIENDEAEPVDRQTLFSVIQKDINAFDIEAEISPVDLRCHRISFCADSRRNLQILKNFIAKANGEIPSAPLIGSIIAEYPEILRTLPSFYPIQVSGGCPQKCAICPYPSMTDVMGRGDFLSVKEFDSLLDKIVAFSKDAVIDLSLWGELSLHPEKLKLIELVLSRPELSLVIETSGVGWKDDELKECAKLRDSARERKNPVPSLSWIVSLDTADAARYAQSRGGGFAEAARTAKTLFSLFPKDCYAQAVRIAGFEDDTEKFYRYWKEAAPFGDRNIIIQKYNDFGGFLEKKQASDISPVIRQSCWHIMRDMPVLIDGTVPLCRDDVKSGRILGNAFSEPLESVWLRGERHYLEHCKKNYEGLCADCDEYYTYNF